MSTGIRYTSYRPCASLAPYVECYWNLQGSGHDAGDAPQLMLPDGRSELMFDLTSPSTTPERLPTRESSPPSYFVGRASRAVCAQIPGNVDLLGISFRPYGAGPFFKPAQDELTDQIVGLDLLWGSLARTVESQLHEAGSMPERITVLERHLRARLRWFFPYDNVTVVEAVRRITNARGTLRIDNLAESLGVTRRRLEKDFARTVGVSPKLLARITRFQSIFYALDGGPDFSWADAVVACGYFDQSHLIRDFRQFCGQTPGEYFAGKHDIAEHFRSVNRAAHSSNTI